MSSNTLQLSPAASLSRLPDGGELVAFDAGTVGRIELRGPDGAGESGGMSDNTVGFLHSPAKRPPPFSPSSHIRVEEVAGGWHLFRTT